MALFEEPFLPFPAPRALLPMATQFRSAWLNSSLRSLRTHSLYDRYLTLLPEKHHEAVRSSGLGVWLSIDVAMAHYAACDALGLDAPTQIKIGAEVAQRVHRSNLSVAMRLAQEAGITPWTVLGQFRRMWDHIWVGGGVAVFKLGPKEARVEAAGWPVARFAYSRNGTMGVTQGLIELFCNKVYIREVPKLCTPVSVGYRIAWA